jgi:small subunit ribosomal protein S16
VVVIRLQKHGALNKPMWRIVTADSKSPRDGRFIEQVGFYDPHKDPAEIRFKSERLQYWLQVGAQPSVAVRNLIRKSGIKK